jgi:GTPase SAR1 family protein
MSKKRDEQPAGQPEQELPPGVSLRRSLRGHGGWINRIAWSPDGRTLASASNDNSIRLWDFRTGKSRLLLAGHSNVVLCVAWSPDGRTLASGSGDHSVRLWDPETGEELRTLRGHEDWVFGLDWSPDGHVLVSGSSDKTIRLWDAGTWEELRAPLHHNHAIYSVAWSPARSLLASGSTGNAIRFWDTENWAEARRLEGHRGYILSLAWSPDGRLLASGSTDGTVRFWDAETMGEINSLEGHTNDVRCVSFSGPCGLLASKSADDTVRLWQCGGWRTAAVIPERASGAWAAGIAFHPKLPVLATLGEEDTTIRLWDLDLALLREEPPAVQSVRHMTAKIILVGDSGVGKTGLGWRLAHGEFKEHASTHGQQFWVVDELGARRADGTECEAILWDLAGQPDYRLTHALFLDDADLALVLFDPTDSRDPLHGVEFWVRQLKSGRRKAGEAESCCPTILVGARADRGEARLTREEIGEFCRQRGIGGGYLPTSAKEGTGLDKLLRRMKEQIQWEQKSATVTTVTFKRIKDYVLGLKESPEHQRVVVRPEDLRGRLEQTDEAWEFTDAEMMTAVGHLANYGYVRVLRTSKGEERILLAPELLNNLAASFVLEARRNPKGLGSLEEKSLLAGEYQFRELETLSDEERDILLDSAALLFLEHNVCFRETDPLGGKSYLVFPELINLKKPLLEDEQATEDGAAYTVAGAVENVYASLVVLLGYTQTFTRTDQWRSHARYEVGDGLICGFRQDAERDGELDLVLYFGTNVGRPVRTLFQGLFESFLARRNLSVFRFEPVICSNGHALNRAVVRDELRGGNAFAFCSKCGEKLTLPRADEPIQLTQVERRKVDEQQWFAAQRSLFEQAVFQVMSYVEGQKTARPECFISYAWGDTRQERWVEKSLAADLQKAGLGVVLDRWTMQVGMSVPRFVEQIQKCDRVIVVGTPEYRKKYDNQDTSKGFVVAAEVDLISGRMLGTEAEKETVLPLLVAGEEKTSLPPLLHRRAYADFRNERAYFITAFDLILSLYKIAPNHPAVADLRESLRESDLSQRRY